MAKHKPTATQRFLLEEQEDLERARKRAETRREAAIELGEIVMEAGGYVLPPDSLSTMVRKAVAERASAGGQLSGAPTKQRAKSANPGAPMTPDTANVSEEDHHESSAAAA